MHFPWISVVSFLGFGLLLGSDGVLGAALPNSQATQAMTVPFRISRGPESLPQHHIYVVNASVAGVPFEVRGRAHTSCCRFADVGGHLAGHSRYREQRFVDRHQWFRGRALQGASRQDQPHDIAAVRRRWRVHVRTRCGGIRRRAAGGGNDRI